MKLSNYLQSAFLLQLLVSLSRRQRNVAAQISITAVEMLRFNNEALAAHNYYRLEHGYEPVQLDETLIKLATNEAIRFSKLDRLDVKTIMHKNESVGVNYAFARGTSNLSGRT